MIKLCNIAVAPVWGRGLKFWMDGVKIMKISRSRVGTWIEIAACAATLLACIVAPVWGRGLKFKKEPFTRYVKEVAPVWGRGLKSRISSSWLITPLSLPCGDVD